MVASRTAVFATGSNLRHNLLNRQVFGIRNIFGIRCREIAIYLRGLGVNATAHQLRHWSATRTYQNCTDLRVVQELLGHESPNSTAIYTAFAPGKRADVVNALRVDPNR